MQTETRFPALISKAELNRALKCTSREQWQKLFTDEVLQEVLKMDRQQFKKVRLFDAMATRRLIDFFSLQPQDFVV